MAFDFKKEYKEFYMPKNTPEVVTVPAVNYIAVRGKGNPNQEGGAYQQAVSILYAIAWTIKMSYKGSHKIEGFFEYVVPPLEGFWWQDNVKGVDYGNKDTFNWISVIRLPEFVTKDDFDWAVSEATKKKKLDCSLAEFLTLDEGLCVQIMHTGPFDDEPATVAIMDKYFYRLAPENWQKAHPNKGPTGATILSEDTSSTEAPDIWSKIRKQSWARLLKKVYEVDPFVCPKCQGTMAVVAIIEDPKELGKIIEWANQQEKEPRLTLCARAPPELALATV